MALALDSDVPVRLHLRASGRFRQKNFPIQEHFKNPVKLIATRFKIRIICFVKMFHIWYERFHRCVVFWYRNGGFQMCIETC